MTAKLKSAFLDIGKGKLTTKDPVDIEMNGVADHRRFDERP